MSLITNLSAKKKAEKEALLAAEEAALPSKPKSAPKAGSKKKVDPAARPVGGGIASFNLDDPLNLRSGRDEAVPVEELSATGIEGMLEALEVANQRTDKQSMGAKVGSSTGMVVWSKDHTLSFIALNHGGMGLTRTGRRTREASRSKSSLLGFTFSCLGADLQRRFKAAFEAYKEDQMLVVKDEVCPLSSLTASLKARGGADQQHPGLRKNQYEDLLYKRFQKAPENRMSPLSFRGTLLG